MGAVHSTCGVTTEGRLLLKAVEDGAVPQVDEHLHHNLSFIYWSTFSGGNTIWHKAAKAGQLGVLKSMARVVAAAYQAPKDTQEAHQMHTLLKVGPNATEAIKRLVNLVNFKRCTPLMLAAARGHTEVVEWLLEQGAMLLVHDRIRHQTALHYAVEKGGTDCVRLLLAAAAHTAPPAVGTRQRALSERQQLLAAGNHAGLTALHYAVHEEKYDAIKLLLAYGADINIQAEYPDLDWTLVNAGDTPLHVAAAKGSIESIRILLKGFVENNGLLCPEHAPPRHIRDPRGVRNDYGRLPYHVAMRKRYAWLAELLDPSVPVRYLLTGEEPDTATSHGPPRLAAIAAKVMHDKLIGELQALKAAASCGGAAGAAPEEAGLAPMNSLQVAQAAAIAAAAERAPRRRWSLNGRRSSCDSDGSAAGGNGAGGGGASAANSGGVGLAALERLLSLPSRVAEVAHGHAQVASGALQTAVDLRDATTPGPARSRAMTPRVSIGSIPEGTLVPRCQQTPPPLLLPHAEAACESGPATGRRSSCEGARREGATTPASPFATAFAHVSLAVSSPAFHGGKREASSLPSSPRLAAGHCGCAGGCGHGCGPRCELEPHSDAYGVADACGGASGSDGGACGAAAVGEGGGESGKAPPNPELLLRPFRRATPHVSSPTSRRASLAASEDGITCGVCLDVPPAACIEPCKHVMCVDCALDMCKRYSLGTAACPFCRTLVAGFHAATHDEMRQH